MSITIVNLVIVKNGPINKGYSWQGGCRYILKPFYCDYGKNIHVGDYFYANFNCVILDVGRVIIGHHVSGPNVSLYTAGHPIHPDSRNSGYEYGIGITIGDNVWIGNVVVNPGVHIGNNVVIGSGNVVTRIFLIM